jgi:hypothetical protein
VCVTGEAPLASAGGASCFSDQRGIGLAADAYAETGQVVSQNMDFQVFLTEN